MLTAILIKLLGAFAVGAIWCLLSLALYAPTHRAMVASQSSKGAPLWLCFVAVGLVMGALLWG